MRSRGVPFRTAAPGITSPSGQRRHRDIPAAVDGLLVLADHDRVPPPVRIDQRSDQGRGLRRRVQASAGCSRWRRTRPRFARIRPPARRPGPAAAHARSPDPASPLISQPRAGYGALGVRLCAIWRRSPMVRAASSRRRVRLTAGLLNCSRGHRSCGRGSCRFTGPVPAFGELASNRHRESGVRRPARRRAPPAGSRPGSSRSR